MPTTERDVEGMFRRLVRAASAAGLDTERWSYEVGSGTYGRAWRLHEVEPFTHAQHNTPLGDSFLGVDRRTAYATLYGMARAFEAVASLVVS